MAKFPAEHVTIIFGLLGGGGGLVLDSNGKPHWISPGDPALGEQLTVLATVVKAIPNLKDQAVKARYQAFAEEAATNIQSEILRVVETGE